ncbi:MAG: phosphoglycerate dehydrogenase [Dehalococcoidales bacterium]|jgi:D-3-phosphoglycerate dehydrogenase|nr:phosphoglycerate dehydrogenase [Dehalococcoidales bacterium]MDD3994462.1 phosphoglycerate dehydrogenase [Dehalococcoidales bacterium]
MRVLVADPIAQEGIDLLSKYAQVDVKTKQSPEEIIPIIKNYDALIVRSQTQVTADIIAAGKNLQIIGRAGVGIDNIDTNAASQHGIIVVNAPTGNTVSAAEHTVALMLSLARNIPQANSSLKSGKWQRADFMGTEVKGKTLGVVGLGNVGSEVARRARGLEMKIIGYDPIISDDRASNLQVELVPLAQLIKDSDFITLHIPLTESTKNIIGEKELATVKPNVRIINAARGGLIDNEALVKAVKEKRVAGAAIDVFENEPCTESPLFDCDKIIVTPHLGASTTEAQTLAATEVVQQIIDVFNGQPAKYAVNAPFIKAEAMPFLSPFLEVSSTIGNVASYLGEGQMTGLTIKYQGEISGYDTNALKAAILGGVLNRLTEERVNVVNANIIAARRGIKVIEQKESTCENYANLITIEVTTSSETITVAGTVLRGETHVVRINDYWIDIVPTGGYFLFSDHRDRPGLIGAVGKIAGDGDVNISYMHLSRLKPRGQALMILALDAPFSKEQIEKLLALPDVYSANIVKI